MGATTKAKAEATHRPSPHPPCYKVCPNAAAPHPDDDAHGGPFGPDPYYSPLGIKMGKTDGNLKQHYRSPHLDNFGGPFGPDPYYVYGSQREQTAPKNVYGFPNK